MEVGTFQQTLIDSKSSALRQRRWLWYKFISSNLLSTNFFLVSSVAKLWPSITRHRWGLLPASRYCFGAQFNTRGSAGPSARPLKSPALLQVKTTMFQFRGGYACCASHCRFLFCFVASGEFVCQLSFVLSFCLAVSRNTANVISRLHWNSVL